MLEFEKQWKAFNCQVLIVAQYIITRMVDRGQLVYPTVRLSDQNEVFLYDKV